MSISANRLEAAVSAIYPEILSRVTTLPSVADEGALWKELSCCILSSQVSYSIAVEAAELIARETTFTSGAVSEMRLEEMLCRPLSVDRRVVRYRFPRAKAQQLARTYDAVHSRSTGLLALLTGFSSPENARRWFVDFAPGVGPKQASMFLRNVGVSYDLAVIDRHVIDYMYCVGIADARGPGVLSTLKGYWKFESLLRTYAATRGMEVGVLDWAIWIVMRMSRSNESVGVRQ